MTRVVRDRVGTTPVIAEGPEIDVKMGVITPKDRIRWGPILAGVVTALSTLVILGLLGLAIGLSVYDVNDPGTFIGLSTGIWGVVSALLAFVAGGAVAGYTAAVPTQKDGMLNGAMVWLVTIPLMVYIFGLGIGSAASLVGNVAQTGLNVASPLVDEVSLQGLEFDSVQIAAQAAGAELTEAEAQAIFNSMVEQATLTDAEVEEVVDTAAPSAWGTLLALLLGLIAAALGGAFGGGRHDDATTVRTARTT